MADNRIEGLDGVLDALQALPREIVSRNGGPARAALARGARLIRDEARRLAPYDAQGDEVHVRDEIVAQRDREPQKSGANERYVVGVRRRAWYWWWVELGTEKQRAQPFLRTAFETQKEQAMNAIVDSLRSGIDRIARKLRRG